MNTTGIFKGIETAATEMLKSAGKDAEVAARAAATYVQQLAPDAELLLAALVQATATGGDITTWSKALEAQAQAAALYTVNAIEELELKEGERLRDLALGALHVALAIAIA